MKILLSLKFKRGPNKRTYAFGVIVYYGLIYVIVVASAAIAFAAKACNRTTLGKA